MRLAAAPRTSGPLRRASRALLLLACAAQLGACTHESEDACERFQVGYRTRLSECGYDPPPRTSCEDSPEGECTCSGKEAAVLDCYIECVDEAPCDQFTVYLWDSDGYFACIDHCDSLQSD